MLARTILVASAVSAGLLFGCASAPQTAKTASPDVAVAAPTVPTVETYARFDFRPGNIGISKTGTMIMSAQPLDNPMVKLAEIMPGGKTRPFTDAAFAKGPNSELKAAIGVRIDDAGTAWVLDLGANVLYGINTQTRDVERRFSISSDYTVAASFLQDFALDQKRNRVIIADMSQGDLKSAPQPAFIVIDLDTGAMRRVAESHPSMMPDIEGGFALNPITIDATYDYVYFGALHGRTIYRVPAASFDGDSSAVARDIEAFGPTKFSDGYSIDTAGNVYSANIEDNAYAVTTPSGDYKIIASLPPEQSWPDGLAASPDGYLYSSSNQLDRTAALAGEETGTGTYLVVRFKPLAKVVTGR